MQNSGRKERERSVEQEVNRVFRDRELGLAERAQAGLLLLGDKLVCDLEEQLAHVVAETHADREVARLLRMMEKRKALLDQIQSVLAID